MTLLFLLPLLAGCLPNRLVIDLTPPQRDLQETEVMADAPPSGAGFGAASPKIAMIDVAGLISHTPAPGLIASNATLVDRVVSRLEKAERDPAVRAIILRVNSPGGTVAASETLYREIAGFRERSGKPVVISMAEVAASGGYYISLAADHIIAQPTSITGSIGVIIQTVNFSKGMAMIGIEARAVTSGPNKDLVNPLEPMREHQYAIMQSIVDDFYDSFRALVLDRRAMIADEHIDTATDGRVMTGRAALDMGLVDETGDLRDAFAAAKSLASVPSARLVKYHIEGREPASPFALTSTQDQPRPMNTGEISIQLSIPPIVAPSAGFYYLWIPPGS